MEIMMPDMLRVRFASVGQGLGWTMTWIGSTSALRFRRCSTPWGVGVCGIEDIYPGVSTYSDLLFKANSMAGRFLYERGWRYKVVLFLNPVSVVIEPKIS